MEPITVTKHIISASRVATVDEPYLPAVTAVVNVSYSDGSSESRRITLWSGDDYYIAGQWTDYSADTRVIDVLRNGA